MKIGNFIIVPFTPAHLGPPLFFAVLKPGFFNLWALFLGSVVMDSENVFWSGLNLALNPDCKRCQHHGFFHSILGALVGSFILALVIRAAKEPLNRLSLKFNIKQSFSFPVLLLSGFVSWISHIILDALVHYDVFLFWPMRTKPLLINWNLYWPLSFILTGIGILSLSILVIGLKTNIKKRVISTNVNIHPWV